MYTSIYMHVYTYIYTCIYIHTQHLKKLLPSSIKTPQCSKIFKFNKVKEENISLHCFSVWVALFSLFWNFWGFAVQY